MWCSGFLDERDTLRVERNINQWLVVGCSYIGYIDYSIHVHVPWTVDVASNLHLLVSPGYTTKDELIAGLLTSQGKTAYLLTYSSLIMSDMQQYDSWYIYRQNMSWATIWFKLVRSLNDNNSIVYLWVSIGILSLRQPKLEIVMPKLVVNLTRNNTYN